MDVVLDQQYTMEHKQPKLNGGKISKRALEALPNYTCHCHVPALEVLVAGRQNGDIVQWDIERGKPGTHRKQKLLGSHSGSVTCLLHHPEYERFLITGSSDATIRVWDIYGNGIEGNRCIQTISAHTATVTALAAHCDVLLSCSCDKTMKVWKADEGRSALKYPWFVVKQLFVFDYWTTCVWSFPSKIAEDTMGEVYVGDSGGGLTMLRSVAIHQLDSEKVLVDELELVRPHIRSFRNLGITAILPVPTLNVVLTCSFDDCVRLSDISTLETLINLNNKQNPGSRYVSMVWSSQQEELILADSEGDLVVWNSRADKFVCSTKAGHKVSMISLTEVGWKHVIIVSTMEAVKFFTIKRTLPYKRHPGHTQRVLGMHIFTNPDTEKDPFGEDMSMISASVDNTIRSWSVVQSLQCTKTMFEKYSEISAFLYLPEERVIVTGHENGSLKMWSMQLDKTWRVAGHTNTISSIAYATHRYTPSGIEESPHVVSASYDGHLAIWETKRDTQVQPRCDLRFPVCRDELLCVLYSKLHQVYITAGNAGEITCWCLKNVRKPTKKGSMCAARDHDSAVTALTLDGNYLFSGGEDETIRMWDLHNYELLKVIKDEGEINDLFIIPSTGNLLSCTRSGGVKMWSQQRGKKIASFDSPVHEELRCLAYCRSLDEVFVGTEDGGILRITFIPNEGADQESEQESRVELLKQTEQHIPPPQDFNEIGFFNSPKSIPEDDIPFDTLQPCND